MICFAEITPAGGGATIRVCSADTRQACSWNAQRWAPALAEPPSLSIRLFDGDFGSATEAGDTSMTLAAVPLNDTFSGLTSVRWQDATVNLYAGTFDPESTVYPYANTVALIFVATVSRFEISGGAIKLSLSAGPASADTKVLSLEYAGTGGKEGSADKKGKLKPWLFGRASNVEPVLIDEDNSVYQFSAYGAIKDVTKLYERGSDFGTSFGDYASYAALVAATIPNGRWATCLAEGMVRLGAPQAGVITGDVDGDYAGSTFRRLTGAIIQRIASYYSISSGSIDSTSLSAIDTFAGTLPGGGTISLYLTEQTTFLELAKRLALPLNAQAGYSLLGKLFMVRLKVTPSTFTLQSRGARLPLVTDMIEGDTKPPYRRIIMGGARVWRVHALDEIASEYVLRLRGSYDAATTYREGNIVTLPDGSSWQYVNPVATAGNTPAIGAYWSVVDSPTAIIAGNANRVRFSQFERGTYGWDEVADAANIVGPISTGATSGKAWVKLAGTATASGQIFSIGNALSGASQTWASGTAGEKTSAQAGIEVTGAVSSTSLVQRFYNSSGAQVGSDAVLQTVSGAQSFNTKLKGFATWPSGAVKSALFVQCTTSGAGAVSVSLIEPMITGATTSQIEHPAFTPGPNSDDAADVTAQAQVEIVRPADQVVYRDWQGTVKTGQFPRTLTVLVTRGGTDIRTADDVTYAITATGVTATINTTTGSTDKGRITVTDGGAGSIVVTVTVGGIARTPQTITFRTEDDTPPINNGSSGGTDSSLASVSSTSFTAMSSTHSGEALLTVTLTSGQTLNANATVDYSWSNASGNGSNALKAKAQYRLVGDTTWLDFAGTVTGSNATWIAVDFSGDPGGLTLAQSKTGLAAGNYETRLVGAKNTSSGNAITINSGSFTASRS